MKPLLESPGGVPYNQNMFRLTHLSDIHLGPLPEMELHQFVSKRAVGFVNWQRNRRRFLHDNIIDTIVADMRANAPDHIAVTGDLVNLALDREIELAKHWLGTLGTPTDVSVVPGNHDAYVPGALDKVCRAWGPWMSDDTASRPVDRHSFPYLRVRGNVALVGTTSARATGPFMANGFFREDQSHRLGAMLDAAGERGLFRVILIHHPPVRNAVPQHKRLFGIGNFQNIVGRHGAELVLHGHSHLPSLHFIDGRKTRVPVVGVAAAGQAPGSVNPAAQYNMFDIDGEPGHWSVRLARRGLTGAATPPGEIESVQLHSADAMDQLRN